MKSFVGIDVGNKALDYFIRPSGVSGSVPRTKEGLEHLIELIGQHADPLVVVEPTAGYERPVLEALYAANIPTKLVPPDRGRYFARSLGRLAKTDPIDASTLAHMAEVAVERIRLWQPPSRATEALRALTKRRMDVVRMLEAERKRLKATTCAAVQVSIETTIELLVAERQRLEASIVKTVAEYSPLSKRAAVLQRVSGVGALTAATLLAEVPELGALSRRQAAALVGVAPYNRDSGKSQGKRHIRGGRHRARHSLYMATFAAIRHNTVVREYFYRLKANGKLGLVAMVAAMRKLLIHLNALLRRHEAKENAELKPV